MDLAQLFQDNINLIHHVINKMPWINQVRHYYDELFAEGRIALWRACQTYNEDKSLFATYACNCIQNRLRNYFSRYLAILSSEESYYQTLESCDYNEVSKLEMWPDRNIITPEQMCSIKEFIPLIKEYCPTFCQSTIYNKSRNTIAKELGVTTSYIQSKIKKELIRFTRVHPDYKEYVRFVSKGFNKYKCS
jgi:RNA polymerase sigma factor (sigma-70 family)